MELKKRIFSGIKPSGNIHIGNYLGAIRQWIKLQDEAPTMFCVVDMHAITVYQSPEKLKKMSYEVAAAYLASGLNPEKAILFNQSHVHQHAELGWIFGCIARIGWMNRMTQFKEKAGKNNEKVSLGLYAYPSLMAADILLYKSTHVPVGEDQLQHVELSRDIAKKFNNDYKEYFPLPKAITDDDSARIMSLKDAAVKMSKSDDDIGSHNATIYLTDSADTIRNKIKKAKSDPNPLPDNVKELENRLEAKNLLSIYASTKEISLENAVKENAGLQFSQFKPKLADLLVAKFEPISKEIKKLMNNKDYINDIFKKGAEKASELATPTMNEVFDILGFIKKEI
jgi:tryptophanyl-tRNA synthetase